MQIKSPIVLDVSRYEIIPDFFLVQPRPFLVITKATEGTTWIDPTFVSYMADLKQDGIHRGCYHFHRKAYDPTAQARHFCNTIRSHIDEKTILVLDVEEGGETAAQLKTFLQYVQSQFPRNLVMIYSRKNILDAIPMFMRWLIPSLEGVFVEEHPLDAIPMSIAEREYFRTIPIWTAGYPANPDLYDSVPSFYVPDQTKFGPVLLWQYSDKAVFQGITGAVDVNWISPALVERLEGVNTNDHVITTPYDGVTSVEGERAGWKFWLDISEPSKVKYSVRLGNPVARPSEFAPSVGLAYNGGEWDKRSTPPMPNDLSVSNGNVYVPRTLGAPSLVIYPSGNVEITEGKPAGVLHAFSGNRLIVRNGAPVNVDGTLPQHTEGHARTAYGLTADGLVMSLVSDGTYVSKPAGLTLRQIAEILVQYGAVTAFDSGSGGDSVRIKDGIVTNTPQDGAVRAVPETFVIETKGNNTMTRYTAKATSNTRIRPDHNTNNNYISTVPAGTLLNGDVLFTATENLFTASGNIYQQIGDKWLQISEGTFADKWVAVVHMGGTICQLTDNGTPSEPPPPSGNMRAELDFMSDGTVKGTWQQS